MNTDASIHVYKFRPERTGFEFVFNLCEETISRTDEGQPRPKYILNKCGTNIYFFTLQRFGPSPSPNFKWFQYVHKVYATAITFPCVITLLHAKMTMSGLQRYP